MSTQNKTISTLSSLPDTSHLVEKDLFLMSKDLCTNTTGNSEYVSYKLTFGQLSAALYDALAAKISADTKATLGLKKLAFNDTISSDNQFLYDNIVSYKRLSGYGDLITVNRNELNLDHLAREHNANYLSDLNLKALSHKDLILTDDLEYGLQWQREDINIPFGGLELSSYNMLSLDHLAKQYNKEYVLDLNLGDLAYLNTIALDDYLHLTGKLNYLRIKGIGNLAIRNSIDLDSQFININPKYLALSTYTDLKLGDLATKNLHDLNLRALAHLSKIDYTYIVNKIPFDMISGHPDEYELPVATREDLGGIKIAGIDTNGQLVDGDSTLFGIALNPRALGYVKINDVTLLNHGLMTREDKTKLDNLDKTIQLAVSQAAVNIRDIVNALYPAGSIYIGVQSACPLAAIVGTWQLVSIGRVLQGAFDSHAAGSTIEAGLPDHKHNVTYQVSDCSCKKAYGIRNSHAASTTAYVESTYASASNAIYGRSTTVQPPAFCVNIWKRIK